MYGFPDSVTAGVARRAMKQRKPRKPTIWDDTGFDSLGGMLVTFYNMFHEEQVQVEKPKRKQKVDHGTEQVETVYIFVEW